MRRAGFPELFTLAGRTVSTLNALSRKFKRLACLTGAVMSAHALLSVVLHKRAVRKASKAGKPYLMASVRDGNGPDAKWWTLFAFTEAAIEALEVLAEGETFAASGYLRGKMGAGRA